MKKSKSRDANRYVGTKAAIKLKLIAFNSSSESRAITSRKWTTLDSSMRKCAASVRYQTSMVDAQRVDLFCKQTTGISEFSMHSIYFNSMCWSETAIRMRFKFEIRIHKCHTIWALPNYDTDIHSFILVWALIEKGSISKNVHKHKWISVELISRQHFVSPE